MKQIKKYGRYVLCVLVALNFAAVSRPESVFGNRVAWAHSKLPSTAMERFVKGGVSGIISAGLGYFFFKKLPLAYHLKKTGKYPAAIIAGLFGMRIYQLIAQGNFANDWFCNLKREYDRVRQLEELAPHAFNGHAWLLPYADFAALLMRLKTIGNELAELLTVGRLLVDCRMAELTEQQQQELLLALPLLEDLQKTCSERYAWVASAADYETFLRLHNRVVFAPELIMSDGNEWMRSASGARHSFSYLVQQLSELETAFSCMQDMANNLLGAVHANTVRASVRQDVFEKMQSFPSLKQLCESRLAFARAKLQYEKLCADYQALESAPVLQQSLFDAEIWMKRFGSACDVSVLSCELAAAKVIVERLVTEGDALLRRDVALHLSVAESDDAYAKVCAGREFLRLVVYRQKIVSALQLLKDFNTEYVRVVSVPVISFGRMAQNDLSWMQVAQGQEYPLEAVLGSLDAVRSQLMQTIERGQRLTRNVQLRVLKDQYHAELQHKISLLQQALELANQRIMFVRHSAVYAEEVRVKQARLEAQRLEQIVREAQERRDREQREHQAAAAAHHVVVPTAPPAEAVVVPVVIVPTAPPMSAVISPAVMPVVSAVVQNSVGECFCGDEVNAADAYVLSCSCKTSVYHKDCIRQWVQQSKNCPTCRAVATLADVAKKSEVLIVAEVVPAVQQPQPSAPPATPEAPAVVAPAIAQDDDRECYLCMDSVGDCTTSNCDCTVKKAACRACLQSWLSAQHTCPRCQKQGATLVDLPTA